MNEWISVKDRLPDDNISVLVHVDGCAYVASYHVKYLQWFMDGVSGYEYDTALDNAIVTHWMPLPESPK